MQKVLQIFVTLCLYVCFNQLCQELQCLLNGPRLLVYFVFLYLLDDVGNRPELVLDLEIVLDIEFVDLLDLNLAKRTCRHVVLVWISVAHVLHKIIFHQAEGGLNMLRRV